MIKLICNICGKPFECTGKALCIYSGCISQQKQKQCYCAQCWIIKMKKDHFELTEEDIKGFDVCYEIKDHEGYLVLEEL